MRAANQLEELTGSSGGALDTTPVLRGFLKSLRSAARDVSRNRTLNCYHCGHVRSTNLGSGDLCA
jgi:hypothetical protein